MSIAIVTDSTSDISLERASGLNITVVPLFVVFGDKSYKDIVELSRAEFYHKLETEKVLPITSQPTAAMFEAAFRPLAAGGNEILCLVISSHLSGTINAARAGAAEVAKEYPGARIVVYDSETVAGGLGMMTLHAQSMASQGASMDEIVAQLDRERPTQRLYACFSDLSHLQRTGRIGKAQALIGSLMKIVPVIVLKNGEVGAEATVRTFSRAQEAMLDLVMKVVTDPAKARFLVTHTKAPALAQAAAEKLRARLSVEPAALDIWEAGPVIATHGGEGAVAVFVA
ncbi:MAG TPA: DegV family protein, partial [Candidatus Acidoferrales bacterium]|nr:DegV family protein [Candidatus Acidoferrales bacterium]